MKSAFHIDPKKYTLDQFKLSLESREMIPSRKLLKEQIKERFSVIAACGIITIGDLIGALKTKPRIEIFAQKTNLSTEYLQVLGREARSYFPNPISLNRFPDIDGKIISLLEARGINNSKQLFECDIVEKGVSQISADWGVPVDELERMIGLADLSRLYGVGPVFAKILYDIGIDSVASLLAYSGEAVVKMYEEKTNKKADFAPKDIDFSMEIGRELLKNC